MLSFRLAARLAIASLAFAGCGRSEGVPDKDLGSLVIAPKEKRDPIDVAKASRDAGELGRALMMPYKDVVAALGPHTYSIKTTNVVEEAGKEVSNLSDTTTIGIAANGFHGVYENSADYGREAIFAGGTLYLKPRYQRWHGRAPETPDEPTTLRDSFFGPISATWDLVAPAAELTDQGTATVAGRAGKKIAVKQSPDPHQPPAEKLVQRKWREKRTIENVTGEVVLDADKGVPLSVKLAGTIGFMRDGRRFSMKVTLDATLVSMGPAQIDIPPPDQVVATPERLKEVDDRDFLLQGIAPPIRKNTDGTGVTPQGTPAGPGSASNSPGK
ncbi:MAG TPA: hypothetical protein VL326_02610 [Kofleriaceae bacterium]|jgi:hypothetical protein|nr:hypothetical protein [Kofleriaceae bacterium]